ncbi:adenylate kinase [Marchantia polymorpha subsp. ruderalis]|uniref:adenylate kinase n=2 Tax=Marchantia polymorpha TaxID=3197 RepID=A0AAF6AVL1_MARPO|nr:hypothetical protein MARPO_0139s0019 [Marchantia polymorpha]BBN00482.1 hypothetical protein Mp_1g29550 [Marchantia polymorpha subsp. ruderalis]|eukprot:PTQ29548.1 hypothetical protein MARPO_0139s0019 [Marchantia polymorpha]
MAASACTRPCPPAVCAVSSSSCSERSRSCVVSVAQFGPSYDRCDNATPLVSVRSQFLGQRSESSFVGSPRRLSRSSKCGYLKDVRVAGRAEAKAKDEPLRIMIAGAPASGKGTQCELIVEKYGLTHISAGDLLRAEVAAGSENGNLAKEYMTKGLLVPSEIVVKMVKDRLAQQDAQENGWLLDGYPRSDEQAQALEVAGIRPNLFILLDVDDEILIQRVINRRMDPVTGKIYHLLYSPPENEEIASRLTQRFDDTEEKARVRLLTHYSNVDAVVGVYKDVMQHVDGNRPKLEVFAEIDKLLMDLQKKESEESTRRNSPSLPTTSKQDNWKGIPTKLNTTPHTREIREYFYKDVCNATKRAVENKITKLKVKIVIPELNPEMDVYRIGTLLELMRELAFTFVNDGKRVRVCVQGAMGEGIFAGMPLQLAGTRQMLERMDWGDDEVMGTFVNFGAVGAKEVKPEDDMFILMCPQNAVGNCIIDDLKAMVEAAGDRPVIILNPRLKDLPGSGGNMQIRGREERMEFADSFFTCYHFRLLYQSGTQYPILGALRMAYPNPYEIYKRVDLSNRKEEYILLDTFNEEPTRSEIGDAYYGRPRKDKNAVPEGIWGFFSRVLG